jgi:hypothetical protein
MAIPGNLPPSSLPQNPTTSYFDNLGTTTPSVSPNTNDAVVGYFQQLTGDATVGATLAAAVISTAQQQNINPLDVVEQLNALSQANQSKSPTYTSYIDPNQQDTDVFVANTASGGNWTTGATNYAKPGPSTPYTNISQVNAFLTMFLNLNRVGTSLLGLSNSPQTSPFIVRAILA